jgi:hypothetical protein
MSRVSKIDTIYTQPTNTARQQLIRAYMQACLPELIERICKKQLTITTVKSNSSLLDN